MSMNFIRKVCEAFRPRVEAMLETNKRQEDMPVHMWITEKVLL